MATTTDNLGLTVPSPNDYVNVKNDISDNFKKIDDEFGFENVSFTQ